jgi:hypothetical protein
MSILVNGPIKINSSLIIQGQNLITNPVNDSSLLVWLDAGDTDSYPGTGTTWTDLTGNGANATLTNSPVYTSGDSGYFNFNGTDESATVTTTTALNALNGNTNSYTVELWVRSTDPTLLDASARIIEKRTTGGTPYPFSWQPIFNTVPANELRCFIFGTQVPFGIPGNNDNLWNGNWHQIVMVVDNSQDLILTYRDGTNVDSDTNTTTTTATNTGNIFIARSVDNTAFTTFDCSILRIYNKALTAQEVSQNYDSAKNRYS